MAGRKPKPTAVKKLEGNPGKRKLNKNEPVPAKGMPECPDWLLPEAKAEWERLCEKLSDMGVLTEIDMAAFAAYCQSFARWKEAQEHIDEEGSTFATDKGYQQQTPWVGIANTNQKLMLQAAAEFGLTPSANVSMMGETFKYCAPIAGALGFSVEDTAEAIGLMANAGIKSTQAGTSLRTIMTNLSGEVKICGENIGEVTVATTNADGSMRDLSDILADCRTAFSGLSESEKAAAAESLVGKNAMSGFLALMNAGEGDIAKLSGAIDNCNGAAQSMADTMNNNLEGQLTILKSQLQELAISFGEILLPAVKKIVGWVQGFIDVLNSLPDGVKETIVTVALIAAALGPVLIIIGKIITAVGTIMTIVPKVVGVIKAVKTAFLALNATMLANPIVLIIAAIVALVAAFIYLWNNCDEFRQFWIDLWESIKEIAVAVWEALKEFFAAAWEFIKTTAETVWNGLASFFTGLWEGIKNTFTIVVNAISNFLSTMWNTIKSVAETIWNAISTFFTTIWNGIKTVVTTVVTAISTFLTTAWNTIKTVITTVLNAIKTVFSTVWNAIKNVITTVINGIKNTITTVWNGIKNTVATVVNVIKTTVSTAFSSMWNGIKNTISGIYNTIKNGFTNAVNFIKNLASSAFSWGADIINGIVNGIKSCISDRVKW